MKSFNNHSGSRGLPCLAEGIYWATGLSLTTPFTEGRPGVNDTASPPVRHQEQAPKQRCTFRPTTFSSDQIPNYEYLPFSSVQCRMLVDHCNAAPACVCALCMCVCVCAPCVHVYSMCLRLYHCLCLFAIRPKDTFRVQFSLQGVMLPRLRKVPLTAYAGVGWVGQNHEGCCIPYEELCP